MSDENVDINCPWMLYHMASPLGNVCYGWQDFDTYRVEVKRLYEHLEKIESTFNESTLLFMVVGAAAEEGVDEPNYKKYEQYRQLFPYYVEKAALQNIPVRIIIISPNETFDKSTYKDLEFIKYTNSEFKWDKICDGRYKSENYDVTVDIFCTPMPCEDMESNKLVIKTAKSKAYLSENPIYIKRIKDMEQIESDVKFIDKFYCQLEKLFLKIENTGGIIMCNSYAVFRDGSSLAKYRNYYMFPRIKQLFSNKYNTDGTKRLLTEWNFNMSCTNTALYMDDDYYLKETIRLCYIDPMYIAKLHHVLVTCLSFYLDNDKKIVVQFDKYTYKGKY